MPPIYYGASPSTKMYLGGSQVSKAYLGGSELLSGVVSVAVKNIVLLGASIENFTFNSAADTTDFQARIASTVPAAAGQVTLYNESANGRATNGARIDWNATIRAKYSTGGATPLPYDGSTLVVFMCYGNDISNMVPYDSSDDSGISFIKTYLSEMIADCTARGWDWHILDISWRDYDLNSFENEQAGAAPYRDRITHALNQELTHPYKNRFYSDGTSWLNYYHLWMRHAAMMSDTIHNNPGALSNPVRQEIVDKLIAPSWTGIAPADTRFTLPAVGADAVGAQAVWVLYDAGLKSIRSSACALGKDSSLGDLSRNQNSGEYLPFVIRKLNGATAVNTAGSATLNLPGHFSAGDLTHSLYCSGSTVAKFAIKRLNPAASYQLVMSGSRGTDSTDLTRMTRIDIVTGNPTAGGSTQQFSASNPASGTTANSVTFVVTPNASGIIEFEMSNDDRVSGSRFGYLGALSVKRVA